MAGEEGAKPSSDKAKKFDTSFKKAVGGSLKLKGVEFKGKKAIVTKKEAAKGDTGSHGAGVDEHKMPGGVRKISNGTVSGRGVGAMSYDPQANLDQRVKQKSDRFCMHT